MNANELADGIESCRDYELPEFVHKTATMLRQQQAEIEELKKLVSEMKYEKSSGVYEMNNEPVAWMDEINTFVLDKDYKQFPKSLQNGMIPLYTHPVKELTDEEIEAECRKAWNLHDQDQLNLAEVIEFARAIEAKVRSQ